MTKKVNLSTVGNFISIIKQQQIWRIDKLLENLKHQGGCLIMPKKNPSGNQKLLLVKKNNESYLEKELLNVKFVPLLNKNIK